MLSATITSGTMMALVLPPPIGPTTSVATPARTAQVGTRSALPPAPVQEANVHDVSLEPMRGASPIVGVASVARYQTSKRCAMVSRPSRYAVKPRAL